MSQVPKYSVLCFGDSNTWGYIPGPGGRYASDVRWPGVLQAELGPDYRVIEEGLNGRTTVWADPVRRGRKGDLYLPPCLDSHRPLDAVILFLGINDLKPKYGATAEDIAQGVGTLIRIIQGNEAGIGGGCPAILVMSPPRIGKLTGFLDQFDGAQENSARLGGCIAEVAKQAGCEFLDTAELVATSDLDGVHLEASAHRTLGVAVAGRVREMIRAPEH